jgi:hypothetical protein
MQMLLSIKEMLNVQGAYNSPTILPTMVCVCFRIVILRSGPYEPASLLLKVAYVISKTAVSSATVILKARFDSTYNTC